MHEVKWDGVRVLVDVTDGVARMLSRNGNVVTAAWPDLSAAPLGDRDLLVDGEVIALNDRGIPDFRVLQHRMHVRKPTDAARLAERIPATLMIFDLLRLDGDDLTGRPLAERRELLERPRAWPSTKWQVPAAYDDGAMLWDATLQQGLEGVVSKRRVVALPVRHPQQGLAQARPPPPRLVRRGRLAAAGRHHRPAGRRAGGGADRRGADVPRPGRQRASTGATARMLQEMLEPLHADRQPVRRRGAARRRRWARPGSSRSSWSTSTPTGSVTIACANRRSRASAPT